MKEETKEELEPILCVRCGKNARDSGVPNLCKSCIREMEKLSNRLDCCLPEISVWFMENRSETYILRKLRERCLKILSTINEIEKERE